jgi:hypothetical protein
MHPLSSFDWGRLWRLVGIAESPRLRTLSSFRFDEFVYLGSWALDHGDLTADERTRLRAALAAANAEGQRRHAATVVHLWTKHPALFTQLPGMRVPAPGRGLVAPIVVAPIARPRERRARSAASSRRSPSDHQPTTTLNL